MPATFFYLLLALPLIGGAALLAYEYGLWRNLNAQKVFVNASLMLFVLLLLSLSILQGEVLGLSLALLAFSGLWVAAFGSLVTGNAYFNKQSFFGVGFVSLIVGLASVGFFAWSVLVNYLSGE